MKASRSSETKVKLEPPVERSPFCGPGPAIVTAEYCRAILVPRFPLANGVVWIISNGEQVMTIELDFRDLRLLAANSEIVKDGIIIKIDRPILPALNMPASKGNEYVVFSLDSSDPRAKGFAWNAKAQK